MSPASKSKSKSAARAAKEQPKASSKPTVPASGGSGIAASAYNPVSGTFHALETAPPSSPQLPQSNGRFRNIDETDDHSGSSLGTAAEYDSVSNNDSCSGESEDQKEKATTSTTRVEPIPGSDTDKRDKIRQKNERKHQRQKERRAQELHERCSGYLMSRKLEVLAQQLVAMGFISERATMALILNEGRVEDSIQWLLDGSDDGKQQNATNLDGALNLKIDIAEELGRIADLEVKFKYTKQEVERAVVSCEGDLDKAAQTLKAQKQEPAAVMPKLEEPGDPVSSANGFSKMAASGQNSIVRSQMKGIAPASVQQQRRDERDFNYTKVGSSGSLPLESTNKNVQTVKRIQSKPDWSRTHAAAPLDKRWPSTSSSPSASYSLASPLQVAAPAAKPEARYTMGGNEAKASLQAGMLREPIIMMQRPQSINSKQSLPSTSAGLSGSSPPASTGWYSNGISSIEMMKVANGGLGHNLHGGLGHSTQGLGITGSGLQQFYPQQNHYQPFPSSPMDSGPTAGYSSLRSSTGMLAGSSSLVVPSAAPTQLAVPSSLGLFTGWGSGGSSGSSSPVDWSMGGSMPQCDYNSVDWSLDSTSLRPSSVKGEGLYDTWSRFVGVKAARPAANGGIYVAGLQESSLVTDAASAAGSHEWTSPFAGKDLFRVPRQFVTFPSL